MEAKYGDKKGSDDDDDDDDGEIEDENGELNDPKEWEDDFLRVLPMLKTKATALYDKDIKFFEPEAQTAHLNEQERLKKAFTDAAARTAGDDNDDDLVRLKPKTADELQAEEEHYGEWLKKHQEMTQKMDASIAAAVAKNKEKGTKESADPPKSAKKKSSKAVTAASDVGGSAGDEILLRFWKEDANLTEDEKFLRKYIWDKMWIENDEDDNNNNSDNNDENNNNNNSEGGKEDEFDDAQDRFEHKYNFRYEEPEGAEITQYPRVIEGSERVNKKAEKRAAKRRERKERKQLEKLEKAQEVARMKALQKELINEKLAQVKKTAGLARTKEEDRLLSSLNFDDDFDPKAWDEKLATIFNDDYYAEEEDKKPVFDHDDFIDNNDQLDKSSAATLINPLHAASEDVNNIDYDADGTPDEGNDEEDNDNDDNNDEKMKTEEEEEEEEDNDMVDKALETNTILVGKHLKKKQKKQQQQKEQEEKEEEEGGNKATMTPEEAQQAAKEAKAMIEKYYNLDFEDIIGDVPCRFKYTNVEPDHSGLTVEDVLCADDDALAKVVPIKKIATYIPAGEQITSHPIRGLHRRIYGIRTSNRRFARHGKKDFANAKKKSKMNKNPKKKIKAKKDKKAEAPAKKK